MDRIEAKAETLMRQAGETADEYLGAAIAAIDKKFGAGYAKAHPDLVGAFMTTAAMDFGAASITAGLQEVAIALTGGQ